MKPRSGLTLAKLAKLDAKSVKRRNRHVAHKANFELCVGGCTAQGQRQREGGHRQQSAHHPHACGSFSAAYVGPASTGSSVAQPPQCPLPDIGVIAPPTPRPSAIIDLNVTPGSSNNVRPSIEMKRKQARPPSTATMPSPRNLFGEMPTPTPTIEAFQSLEAFKARHNNKPFTLTHCWRIINNCPKFKDRYRELQRKRGKKTVALAGGGDGNDGRGKEEQMKKYLELQTKKFEMEEAAKNRNIDMEEASRQRQLDIEATNAATKAKEVVLAIMSVDLSKMSEKTRSWFEVCRRRCSTPTT
ncbi:putative DBINO protein [Hordeum vulgare]|nr:putative DBINO protein [Hordeum vulgare]